MPMSRLTCYSLLFLTLVSISCLPSDSIVSKGNKEEGGPISSTENDLPYSFSLVTHDGILTHKDILSSHRPVLSFFGASY